ncbi:MAG: sensor histidine kinase [Dechloromonas sp.]|uniref:Sensor histidine kinase n=1 Tax=Candidatus Dechloromonas phosphorivorans TaxID=2899244 RepID=A0A935MYE3_9RHOO|nr:sensor histidine kinase [Candidatus Dechloromonas phosphorivorans]
MRKRLIYLLATLVFNTAIGGLLTLLKPEFSLRHNLVFAHCIGLTFALVSLFILGRYPSGRKRLAALVVCVTIGVSLAMFITDLGGWHQPWTGKALAIGLFFCLIGTIALLLAERIDAEIKQRQLLASESEKRETEAHLKLLQAQIEPHFLFNTLANLSSLIDSDPALAKSLLERLNDWLRVALARARSERSTLADELEMLENYLQIMKIRFGDRLHWHLEAPAETRHQPFPPMLLQPLVENAVRHGIEPKLGGGEIGIKIRVDRNRLDIEVSDNGMGLTESSQGTGLSNVSARLASLFGDAGRLTLNGNAAGGATAKLTLPITEQSA